MLSTIKATAVGAVALVALSACAGTSNTSAKAGDPHLVAATPAVETSAPPSDTDVYLQVVRAAYPVLNKAADQKLVDFGHKVCFALEQGNSLADVVMVIRSTSGAQSDALEYTAGAAIAAYCPRFTP